MKALYIIGIGFLMPLLSASQDIAAHTENGVAVVEHIVAKGQGIQSIAARYKANYSEVLKLNNLSGSAVLKEGEKVKVPIAKIIQASCSGPDCIKVYHKVQQSEGLYRIGVNYGNIKMAQLKTLNNLSAEAVSIGQKLLVGYLPLPVQAIKTEVIDVPAVAASNVEVPKVEPQKPATPKVEPSNPVPQPPVVVKIKETAPATPTQTATAPAPAPAMAAVPVSAPAAAPVAATASPDKEPVQAVTAIVPAGKSKGFFAAQFAKGTAEISGKAASFKSESGWTDSKFYILMNDVQPGAVVMVATSANTSNYIYAKVLGALPQVKENNNIKFRLNDAGASVLGVGQQDSFQVTIVY